ncbi:MAG: hypothetical protein H0X65_11340 [Gemmatimonadetes bacterium]|nr:hypothetical protein [Gemmatimonadota bacterium]
MGQLQTVTTSGIYGNGTTIYRNVVGLMNANNQLVNEYRYQPFGGHEHVREGLASTLMNWGREYDRESHLLYVRNR